MQLSDLIAYVKRDFKRTDKDTEVLKGINDTIYWLAAQLPLGNYKFQSWINTTVGAEDIQLPTNLMHLVHPIRLLKGATAADSGYPLEHLTKDEYDLLEPNPNRTGPSTGCPSAYTIWSRSILLTPIPDSAVYLIEINWSKRPTTLSADADLASLGAEWDEVIKQGTLERVYAGMGLLQESAYWASLYREQDHSPAGLCRRLIDAERDREGSALGQVRFNQL